MLEDEINELEQRKLDIHDEFYSQSMTTRIVNFEDEHIVMGFNVEYETVQMLDTLSNLDERIRRKQAKLKLFKGVVGDFEHLRNDYIRNEFKHSKDALRLYKEVEQIERRVKNDWLCNQD